MNGINQTQLRQDIEVLRKQVSRLEQDAQALAKQGKHHDAQVLREQAQTSREQASKLEQDYNPSLEVSQIFKRQADIHFGGGKKRV